MQSYRKQLEGCWLGKNIGGILGTPFEGFPTVNHVTFYQPVPTEPLPNDDVELQLMYAAAFDLQEHPAINRKTLAEIWEKHFSFHCDEYAVALRNLRWNIRPPWSGIFDNAYTDGMGAAIRSELWACLAPGNPELAAKFAAEDACIDHAGDGIHAEVFLAALESDAFTFSGTMEELIQRNLIYLPENSLLKKAILETISLFRESGDWLKVRNCLFERYASEFKTCVTINVPFTILALLHGKGDFSETICTAVNCGMDTDCSGATAGALLGILNPESIPEKWIAPIGRGLVMRPSAVHGLTAPADIDGLCNQIERLRKKIPMTVEKIEFPEPDYQIFQRTIQMAVQENQHWYHVELEPLNFQTIKVNPVNGKIDVPEYRNGLQIILKFKLDIPEDGAYSIMFNSITSNQCYLAPEKNYLHDSENMLFGRQRLWLDEPVREGRYPVSERPIIFSPTLGGAPLNQIKRHIPLKKGVYDFYAVLEPFSSERTVSWGFGVGRTKNNAFLDVVK